MDREGCGGVREGAVEMEVRKIRVGQEAAAELRKEAGGGVEEGVG